MFHRCSGPKGLSSRGPISPESILPLAIQVHRYPAARPGSVTDDWPYLVCTTSVSVSISTFAQVLVRELQHVAFHLSRLNLYHGDHYTGLHIARSGRKAS